MTLFRRTTASLIALLLLALPGPAMAANFYSVSNPYMQIFNLAGTGLNTGKVYFGVAGQDPITHPITVYWDLAGTVPASQPIQTSGGYLYRNGAPAAVYLASANFAYSIKVLDKNNAQIYFDANVSPPPISPITSTGDLIIGDGPYSSTRLPIGPRYSTLTSNGTTATWPSPTVVNIPCTNTSADQTNMDAAVASLKAANGGLIQLGPGTCRFDGIVMGTASSASQVNINGTGEYGATIVQATGRANYVFNVGSFTSLTNLRISGTSTNLGGVTIGAATTSYVANVEIEGFTGSSAWGMDIDGTTFNGSLRNYIDHVYIYHNSHGLRLRGIVNDFKFNNSTIADVLSTDAGAVISAIGGTSIDAYFNNIDLASSLSSSPIKCTASGNVLFDGGLIEDLIVGASPGATIANAKVFDFAAPCYLKLYNMTWTGFLTDVYNFTGTPTFVDPGADPNSIDIANVIATQVPNPGAVSIAFVRLQGVNTRVSLRNNYISCILCTTLAQGQAMLTAGWNTAYGTKWGDFSNNITYVPGQGGTVYGFKQQLGSFTDVQTANAASGANTVLDTVTFPTRSFWQSRTLVWKGCGKTTGAAGAHTVDFSMDTGGATTYNVSTTATAQDWCATVNVFYNALNVQSVNVNGLTGVTPIQSVTAAAVATSTFPTTFKILGTAAGGDTVTLTSSYWELQ